jgi:hypothetical protein
VGLLTATNDPSTVITLATACLLASNAVPAGTLEYIQRTIASVTNGTNPVRCQLALGLTDYRQGRFADATDAEGKFNAGPPEHAALNTSIAAVLALAQQQLQRTNEASASFAKAEEWYEANQAKLSGADFGPDWRDWLSAIILLREASSTVSPVPATKGGDATK